MRFTSYRIFPIEISITLHMGEGVGFGERVPWNNHSSRAAFGTAHPWSCANKHVSIRRGRAAYELTAERNFIILSMCLSAHGATFFRITALYLTSGILTAIGNGLFLAALAKRFFVDCIDISYNFVRESVDFIKIRQRIF